MENPRDVLAAARRLGPWVLLTLAALVAVGVQFGRWHLADHRWICVDEFEHLHAAWCITPAGGAQVPYKDFFEHHTPLLYYALAPILHWLDPAQSFDAAWAAVLVSRRAMWAIALVITVLIYRLGKAHRSRVIGGVAVVFTLMSMKFLDRTIEIRPDMLSVPCILAAILLTLRAIRQTFASASARPRSPWKLETRNAQLFAAGVLFGLAVLATPKTLFALLGYAPAMLGFLPHVARRESWRSAFRLAGIELAGFLLPIAALMLQLATRSAAWDFIEHNFLLNARWKFHLDKWAMVGEVIYENPFLAALGLAGLLATLARCALRPRHRERGDILLAATTAGLIAGAFIIPVPYDEYFLMLIPLLAIFAATALFDTARALASLLRRPRPGAILSLLLTATLFTAVLCYYRPPLLETPVMKLAWLFESLAALWLIWLNLRPLAVAALLLAMLTFAAPRFESLFTLTNDKTRTTLRYVHAHTAPSDPVMDGWDQITAPFRPHAFYYFFLHREVRAMLTDSDWQFLRDDIASGKFRPALIVFDQDNQSAPPDITAWIRAHYERIPASDIGVQEHDAVLWRPRTHLAPGESPGAN